jgi:uncharacterized protein YpmB
MKKMILITGVLAAILCLSNAITDMVMKREKAGKSSELAAIASVRAEKSVAEQQTQTSTTATQKTYRVSFRINPVINTTTSSDQ